MARQQVVIPYTPRPAQQKLHENVKRFNVVVWHRRAGKTVWAVNHLIKQAISCNLNRPQLAYVAPTYQQVKRVAWAYIKEFTAPIPGVQWNEAELRCDFLGRRIYLLGADNYNSLRGMYLDYAILDEFGDMKPDAWQEVIRPALSDREGGAIMMGTPRGRNHLFDALERAKASEGRIYHSVLRASESGILPQSELDDARSMMTAAKYAREYECSFDDAENAMFKRDWLLLADKPDTLTSVCVAIDPAVTSKIGSDETGIIAAGRDGDTGYVLADRSGQFTPEDTISRAITLYEQAHADCIVVEVNNGGDYLKSMIRAHPSGKNIKVVQVRATRGKALRAEPISALYERGSVYHCEYFNALEDQMCTWEQNSGDSPDRLDALVWALTHLFKSGKKDTIDIVPVCTKDVLGDFI